MSTTITAKLQLIPGIQLTEFDSSSLEKMYRIEMADGRHFQINEKLYWLLDNLNVPCSLGELRQLYQDKTGERLALDQLTNISEHLQVQGVISPIGEEPVAVSKEPQDMSAILLGLSCRRPLVSAERVAPLASLFSILFTKPVAIVGLIVIALVHVLVYRELGFPFDIFMEGISWPKVYVLGMMGVLVHEIGHLAACHRFGCAHGPLGVGLYFLNPVFYVDVTDAWRLKRWQRVIIDLGGLYLELFLIPIFWLLYVWSADPSYLILIVISDLWILGNFEPFMKLDGYWFLSDISGVPNLHKRTLEKIKEIWQRFLWMNGYRDEVPEPSAFSQWTPAVRRTVWSYVVVSIAIWPLILVAMVPVLYMAITIYLPLWQESAMLFWEGLRTRNMTLVGAQLEPLFIPVFSILNMAVVLLLSLRLFWKRRQRTSAS